MLYCLHKPMDLLTENQSNIRHIDKQKLDKPEAFYALLHKLNEKLSNAK